MSCIKQNVDLNDHPILKIKVRFKRRQYKHVCICCQIEVVYESHYFSSLFLLSYLLYSLFSLFYYFEPYLFSISFISNFNFKKTYVSKYIIGNKTYFVKSLSLKIKTRKIFNLKNYFFLFQQVIMLIHLLKFMCVCCTRIK